MGIKTGIEWTDSTWNPFIGCSRVSEGCRHCYAETLAGRFVSARPHGDAIYDGLTQITNGRPVWTGRIKLTSEESFLKPLRWRGARRIFVNSMSDLFHENVPDEWIDKVFAVMALAPRHTFQILTKRPQRMLRYFEGLREPAAVQRAFNVCAQSHAMVSAKLLPERWVDLISGIPRGLPNVWLGVSVENQEAADERIPLLLQTPAAVRFISAEPLLGLLAIGQWVGTECRHEGSYSEPDTNATVCRACEELPLLDWVICGGESGPGARPMHPGWARSLRDQCVSAGLPFFFKQWGEWFGDLHSAEASGFPTGAAAHRFSDGLTVVRAGKKKAGSLLDGREWKQFPEIANR